MTTDTTNTANTRPVALETTLKPSEIVASGVSVEEYLAQYAATFHEWVEGVVVKMSPSSTEHMNLTLFLVYWFGAYFGLNAIGRLAIAPYGMRLDPIQRVREPDLQVILNSNPSKMSGSALNGAADVCIEIVSPESIERDYNTKFKEYEQAGVREYWIIDPLRRAVAFHRLDDAGVYIQAHPDPDGHYRTPLLPGLGLPVATLWQDPLPDNVVVVQTVQAMLTPQGDE